MAFVYLLLLLAVISSYFPKLSHKVKVHDSFVPIIKYCINETRSVTVIQVRTQHGLYHFVLIYDSIFMLIA
jgi:hypothetical protein